MPSGIKVPVSMNRKLGVLKDGGCQLMEPSGARHRRNEKPLVQTAATAHESPAQAGGRGSPIVVPSVGLLAESSMCVALRSVPCADVGICVGRLEGG